GGETESSAAYASTGMSRYQGQLPRPGMNRGTTRATSRMLPCQTRSSRSENVAIVAPPTRFPNGAPTAAQPQCRATRDGERHERKPAEPQTRSGLETAWKRPWGPAVRGRDRGDLAREGASCGGALV